MLDYLINIVDKQISNFIIPLNPVSVLEIAVIAAIIYIFYKRYIQGTQSERPVKGIMMLLLALLFSKLLILLKLQILGKFLESLVSIVIFGLVVVFQPELRRFLGYLGQPGFLSRNIFNTEPTNESASIANELAESIKYLSKSRTGALIVIQNAKDGTNYFEVGTKLNAVISTELLLTIFHPNTALHDGAVVIHEDKILAAGVLLPLTEDPKLSWKYGTRHRAAIGMTEISDSFCLVVSEETGEISMVQSGVLKKCDDIEELKNELDYLYGFSETESQKGRKFGKFNFNNFFSTDFPKFQTLINKDAKNK